MKPLHLALTATMLAGGVAAVAWTQTDDSDRARPRVNPGMHGPAAAAPAPDPDRIRLPEQMSASAYFGQLSFDENCASCHGAKGAGGTEAGPPLVHPIYEPGHHPDGSFVSAALSGVRSHHWEFGDMPAIDGVTEQDALRIASYIREIQVVNGIE